MTHASGISLTPRLPQASYHVNGGNVNGTRHEIKQPRRPVGYKDNTSNPDPVNWLTQENDKSTSHYSISTTSACAQFSPFSCQRCPGVCADANWVIERLPVTHSGRSDALGLRSVNTIFHHHDSTSLRPSVCSLIFDVVHILTSCICVRPPQHIKMQQYGRVHIDRNKTKRARLNLCEDG